MGATTLSQDTNAIETEVRYWQDFTAKKRYEIDFTSPEAEEEYEALQKLRKPYKVKITNIRGREEDFELDVNGFQYVKHDVPELASCKTEQEISDLLLPATEELIKKITGASRVLTFTHRIRSKSTDDNKRADNKAPALSVHSDFTPNGAVSHLRSVIPDATEREEMLSGRMCIINVWRPLKTIDRDPLAVCDWTSSSFERDWVAHRFMFPHGWNELGAIKYNDQHRWYYLRHQTPSEPLVFKQYDSRTSGEGGQCVAHTAFVDPDFIDTAPRESIEIKMFAFMPDA